MAGVSDEITVGEDGESFPVMELLTGRGFVTGKSGSGKSNTASVVAEALLDEGLPLLVIDTDGEYYGLKEEYEMLHVGADAHADVQVGPDRADTLADLALEENVPIIIDVSGFVEKEEGNELIDAVVTELFVKENEHRKPFLLLVEEMHEFVPESGGFDDVGETIIRVAKRGRKRGLGVVGMSQRPAAVAKDFITQCDWIVWHRLTWENDTRVVERVLGDDSADQVETLDPGEAIVMTDWDESIDRFKFRRKRTFDAGATPDLTDVDRPTLKSVDSALISRIERGDRGPGATTDDGEPGQRGEHEDGAASDTAGETAGDSSETGAGGEAKGPTESAAGSAGEAGAATDGDDESAVDGESATEVDVSEIDIEELREGAPNAGSSGTSGRMGSRQSRSGPTVEPGPERDDPVWEFGQLTWFLLVRTGRGIGSAAGRTSARVRGAVAAAWRRAVAGYRSRPRIVGNRSDAAPGDDRHLSRVMEGGSEPSPDDDVDPLADGTGRPNDAVGEQTE